MRIREAQKEEIRSGLIRTGLRLFSSQGFYGTSVDQIVAEAGVAKGTFYSYFKTKEDLALATLLPLLKEANAQIERLAAGPFNLHSALTNIFSVFSQWMTANPELIWIWCIENLRRGTAEPGSALFHQMLVTLFERAQSQGQIRPDRTAVEIARDLEGITLAHIAGWYHDGAQFDLRPVLHRAIETYLNAIMT